MYILYLTSLDEPRYNFQRVNFQLSTFFQLSKVRPFPYDDGGRTNDVHRPRRAGTVGAAAGIRGPVEQLLLYVLQGKPVWMRVGAAKLLVQARRRIEGTPLGRPPPGMLIGCLYMLLGCL